MFKEMNERRKMYGFAAMALAFILVMAPSINFCISNDSYYHQYCNKDRAAATDGSDSGINNSAINKR